MIGVYVIAVLIILYFFFYHRESKFKEIERQQAMRRAVLKLHEKDHHYSH